MILSDYSKIQVIIVSNISDYHLKQEIGDFHENGTEGKMVIIKIGNSAQKLDQDSDLRNTIIKPPCPINYTSRVCW